MSKERPILFSGPMVRAILDGRKTQTRRVVKRALIITADDRTGATDAPCPYGVPGDRLWVKEAVRFGVEYDSDPPRDVDPIAFDGEVEHCTVWYEATSGVPKPETGWGKLRPSMFMPRWASRITLEVVSVRVEAVEEISEVDAIAEGMQTLPASQWYPTWRETFLSLFYDLNERAPRGTNPWVWVVEFKRVQP